MRNVSLVLAVVFALFSTTAFAGEDSEWDWHLIVSGLSKHTKPCPNGCTWNEINRGVGIGATHEGKWGTEISFDAGVIDNSMNGKSVYVTEDVQYILPTQKYLKGIYSIGVKVGLTTYPIKGNPQRSASDVFLVILPSARACTNSGYCMHVNYIPEVKGYTYPAWLLYITVPLKL